MEHSQRQNFSREIIDCDCENYHGRGSWDLDLTGLNGDLMVFTYAGKDVMCLFYGIF